MKLREKEKRKRNIVLRGVEDEKGRRREVVEGLFKEIEADVKIEDIKGMLELPTITGITMTLISRIGLTKLKILFQN